MISLSRFVVTGYYKKILIAVCLCAAVFAGIGFVGGQGFCEENSRETASAEERFEYFNDFTVFLKNNNRKDRFLICDVAIELNQGMKLPEERAWLRKIIYKALKELSSSPEIRRELKKAIKIRLNNFMDDEIIKNVYFTKFILL